MITEHAKATMPCGGCGNCHLCHLYETKPKYKAHWDGAPTIPVRTNCVYLAKMRRLQECTTCNGVVKIKVFDCRIHGECTMGKALDGIACCETCGDFQSAEQFATIGQV